MFSMEPNNLHVFLREADEQGLSLQGERQLKIGGTADAKCADAFVRFIEDHKGELTSEDFKHVDKIITRFEEAESSSLNTGQTGNLQKVVNWIWRPPPPITTSQVNQLKATLNELRIFHNFYHDGLWNIVQDYANDPNVDLFIPQDQSGRTMIDLSIDRYSGEELIDRLRSIQNLDEVRLKYIDLSGQASLTSEQLIEIITKCPDLESLNLSGCRHITDAAIMAIAYRCPNMKHLDLTPARNISSDAIEKLARGCPKLCSLNLQRFELDLQTLEYINIPTKDYNPALLALAEHCPDLQSLNLYGCDEVTDDTMIALVSGCPGLKNLDLSGCKLITDATIYEIAARCRNLEDLNLTYCNKVSSDAIIALAKGCPELSSLNLERFYYLYGSRIGGPINDAALTALGNHCSKLLKLNLQSLSRFTDVGIIALANGCPKLQSVNLSCCPSEISDAAIEALAENCPDMQELHLWENKNITANAISRFTNLRILNLSQTQSMNEEGLAEVARQNPNLEDINLFGCGWITTGQSIIALAQNCKRLKSVNLNGNLESYGVATPFITDEAVIALAKNCPDLKKLQLSGQEEITDRSIKALVDNSSPIEKLHLSDCDKLTNNAINMIADNFPNITFLNLVSTCDGMIMGSIGTKALLRLVNNCPNLQQLYLEGTGSVWLNMDSVVLELADKCPKLQTLNPRGKISLNSLNRLIEGCPDLRRIYLNLHLANQDDPETRTEVIRLKDSHPEINFWDI